VIITTTAPPEAIKPLIFSHYLPGISQIKVATDFTRTSRLVLIPCSLGSAVVTKLARTIAHRIPCRSHFPPFSNKLFQQDPKESNILYLSSKPAITFRAKVLSFLFPPTVSFPYRRHKASLIAKPTIFIKTGIKLGPIKISHTSLNDFCQKFLKNFFTLGPRLMMHESIIDGKRGRGNENEQIVHFGHVSSSFVWVKMWLENNRDSQDTILNCQVLF